MKIKNWNQFIKESIDFWITKSDIEDFATNLTDEGYQISISEQFFWEKEGKIEQIYERDDIIELGSDCYVGYRITINKSTEKTPDMTMDFRGLIRYLENQNYKIIRAVDTEGNVSFENLYFRKGNIITWIPEIPSKPFPENDSELADGDVEIYNQSVSIYCYQSQKIKVSEVVLAQIYSWSHYITEGEKIYLEIDIEDLANCMLSSKSSYIEQLINGIDDRYYELSGYEPTTDNLFRYDLNQSNRVLAIKCLIKELGGLENFIEECHNENLVDLSEEEVINLLLKERYYETLKMVCKESEIIDEIKDTVGNWELQAHIEQNQKDLEEEFDDILDKEGISFTKEMKLGKRYYFKTMPGTGTKQKVYYEDNVWFYKIRFDHKWISEDTGYQCTLISVFSEWCANQYYGYQLEPNFRDWGNCDSKLLNRDIEGMLERYLKD